MKLDDRERAAHFLTDLGLEPTLDPVGDLIIEFANLQIKYRTLRDNDDRLRREQRVHTLKSLNDEISALRSEIKQLKSASSDEIKQLKPTGGEE